MQRACFCYFYAMNVILMAEIVNSEAYFPSKLMEDFDSLVHHVNESRREAFLSPLTITLGDGFLCIVKTLKEGVSILMDIEEYLLEKELDFKLRYALVEGEIETPINPVLSHGMMGTGLTLARELLGNLKSDKKRFALRLSKQEKLKVLNDSFKLYQYFVERWSKTDLKEASLFIQGKGYKEVAGMVGKDDSTVWRKRKSLAIDEYLACKDLIKVSA